MRGLKTILHRTNLLAAAFALVVSVLVGGVPAHATTGNTCIWTGATDLKFSTATNWSSCGGVAPQTADTLSFGSLATAPSGTLTNDLGHAVAGVVLTAGAKYTAYTIDNLTLASGAVIDGTAVLANEDVQLTVSGTVTANGSLNLVGVQNSTGPGGFTLNAPRWIVNGLLTLIGSSFDGSQVGSSGVVLQGTSYQQTDLSFFSGVTAVSYPISVTGGGYGSLINSLGNMTISSPVVLSSDATACSAGGSTLNFTGSLTANGHSVSKGSVGGDQCTGTVNFKWGTAGSGGSTQNSPAALPTPSQQGAAYNTYSSTNTSSGAFSDPLTSSTNASQTTVITKSFGQAANGFIAGTNVPIVEGTINMSSGSADLTGATLDSSLASYSAVAHNFANTTTNGQYTLFIPYRNGDKAVGICPGAANLAAVSSGCPNLYYLADGQSKTSKDTTSIPAGVTVTAHIQTINGSQYWQVSGLTGTGGFSTPATPPNTGFFAPTLANPAFVAVLGLASLGALALVRKTAKR